MFAICSSLFAFRTFLLFRKKFFLLLFFFDYHFYFVLSLNLWLRTHFICSFLSFILSSKIRSINFNSISMQMVFHRKIHHINVEFLIKYLKICAASLYQIYCAMWQSSNAVRFIFLNKSFSSIKMKKIKSISFRVSCRSEYISDKQFQKLMKMEQRGKWEKYVRPRLLGNSQRMAVEVNSICCLLIELKRRTKIEWNEHKFNVY